MGSKSERVYTKENISKTIRLGKFTDKMDLPAEMMEKVEIFPNKTQNVGGKFKTIKKMRIKGEIIMQKMTLHSETEFAEVKGHWSSTYNIACAAIFIIVFLAVTAGGKTDAGGALFVAFIACLSAFLIKGEVAKIKKLGLRSCVFTLSSGATAEEIGQKVAYPLLEKGIQTDIADGVVNFKGKTAIYTLIRDQSGTCFSLDWGYPLGKLFSPMRWQYISDYKEVLSELGRIAYYIQQV